MNFPTPTSKANMLEILKDIFYYFRFQPIEYANVELKELDLPRMQYAVPTKTELTARAETLLSASHTREIEEKKADINSQIVSLSVKLNKVDGTTAELIEKLETAYLESKKKAESEALKKGISFSDVVQERIVFLENEKNQKILEINLNAEEEKSEYQSKITALEEELEWVESFFAPIHALEVSAKALELKDEYDKTYREVFEYNNSLERREQEYSNSIIRARASLELQYMKIRSEGISKEELINMGYYEAVMDCVCAYYDTLTSVNAYNDMLSENRLIPYLEDYYQDLVFVYRNRALDQL